MTMDFFYKNCGFLIKIVVFVMSSMDKSSIKPLVQYEFLGVELGNL